MGSHVERERKWLVRHLPPLGVGATIRQGYLAVDRTVTVRIRERDDACTGTIKGGDRRERTEVEWALTRSEFDALWPLTEDRRVAKVRHEVHLPGSVAEVDVFTGSLDGLVLVEVEFGSLAAMDAFDAPGWFGPDVSHDPRYRNAHLAAAGLPADHPVGFPAA